MHRKIAFISQSGNVMKTSLAYAMAIESVVNGLSFCACDLDIEHRNLSELRQKRDALGLSLTFNLKQANNAREALQKADNENLYLIDCPSRATAATKEVCLGVDVCIQPTTTSKKDMDLAIKTFYQLVADGVPIEKLVFVITRALTEPKARAAREYLSQASIMVGDEKKYFTILPTVIYEKASYDTAMNDGFSIIETSFDSLNIASRAVLNEILTQCLKHD